MTNLHVRFRRRQARSRGQSLVEFSLVVVPFVFIMMGIFDLGRGIYMMNGTAEAAREIARVTSVHSGCPLNAVSCDLGSSTETASVVATQRRLVPGLAIEHRNRHHLRRHQRRRQGRQHLPLGRRLRPGAGHLEFRADHARREHVRQPRLRVIQPGEVLPVSKERQMDHEPARERQQGQVMVLFLLAIFAIIGMVGLVLDGGSVFAQRRDQQTAADLAAMAGAAAYLNATGTADQRVAYAEGVATSVATANGYVEGTSGVDIEFSMNAGSFFNEATVNLAKPHRNNFAAILGMPTWDVGVTATARSTFQANGARGAMPLLFNAEAFPGAVCNEEAGPCTPTGLPAAWHRQRGRAAGRHAVQLDDLLHGQRQPVQRELERRRRAHQRRRARIPSSTSTTTSGRSTPARTTRCSTNSSTTRSGTCSRCRWSTMTATWSAGDTSGSSRPRARSDKVITGYFVSPVNGEELVVNGGHKSGELFTGAYSVRLTN